MPGWGAYVPEAEYQRHIANYVDQPEVRFRCIFDYLICISSSFTQQINTCHSQHDALVRAATRSSPGYLVSGVVAVICSRHCMIRKNGAGDLQKGEKYVISGFFIDSSTDRLLFRYCNVDFIIIAALVGINLLRTVLTYDIVCQWSKNFRKCMEEFLVEMQIPDTTHVDVAIPGWHINGHGQTCWDNFNLSYLEGAGRTVGEDIETTWAGTNLLAPIVWEMGPAVRHDTLNNHWNGWNFHKIMGFHMSFISLRLLYVYCLSILGILFLKRFNEAFKMSIKQTDIFNQLSATFPPETVKTWEAMVAAWNSNCEAPNPYQEPKSS
jgi:hypothetical protein